MGAGLPGTMAYAGLLCLLSALAATPSTQARTYYVANDGSDANDGCTPDKPWQSLGKVNATAFEPGDRMLFHRGDAWRGQLKSRSGNESGAVTYGAYGDGAKPLLLGSVKRNRPEDWRREAGNIWATTEPLVVGAEMLLNPSFATDAAAWNLYCEGAAAAEGARDTGDFDSAPASYRIRCARAGKRNSDIQFYTAPFRIEAGRTYRLNFHAKMDKGLQPLARFSSPVLMKSGAPWTAYGNASRPASKAINAAWTLFEIYYSASVTADDARLTLFLGQALPDATVLHIDTLSLVKCDRVLARDVGNLIFNAEAACGVKVWKEQDLRQQGQFWYDEDRHVLKIYSEQCPAEYYSDIECALTDHIIDESNASYVTYENLALKYGAAHGFGGGGTHHIIVRDCDLGFIGGGDQMGGEQTVRYGNGIEFWGAAHDNLVERCRLWEIYDAALTNQSSGPATPQYNLTYRFNVIWNCEYSFEYWNRPEDSVTHHVYFDNNTCVNAGHGWGHAQRPDPSGRHLCFYTSPAPAHDVFIRNNIFYEAKGNAFYAPTWPRQAIDSLEVDHNCWYQASGDMISLEGAAYPMSRFTAYQTERGKGPHSITAIPGFVDPAHGDFHLAAGSPCIDAGVKAGYKRDFDGTEIPQGRAPDIGALERKQEEGNHR